MTEDQISEAIIRSQFDVHLRELQAFTASTRDLQPDHRAVLLRICSQMAAVMQRWRELHA